MPSVNDDFIAHIQNSLKQFGVDAQPDDKVDGTDIQKLNFSEKVSGTSYVAFAAKKDSKDPKKFWTEVLDKHLLKTLNEEGYADGMPAPAAIVIPSSEVDTLLDIAYERKMSPTAYQLFDGYVMVGFRRKDTSALVKYHENNKFPKKDEKTDPAAVAENVEPIESSETVDYKPTDSTDKKSSLNLKKVAAAALLGVTLASVPYAINKYKSPMAAFIAGDNNTTSNAVDNKTINDSLYGKLADNKTLSAIANNSNLDKKYIEQLLNTGFKSDAALNNSIPPEILRKLATDNDAKVRAAVAKNSATPIDVLQTFASDPSADVRAGAATNANLPLDALNKLAYDNDTEVRSAVLENANLIPALIGVIEPTPELTTCENKEKILASPCTETNRLVYEKNNPNPCVRAGVAANPNTPAEILMSLASDTDRSVRDNALKNKNMPKEFLENLFADNKSNTPTVQAKLDRVAALSNPSLPPYLFSKAIAANDPEYNSAIASNTALPKSIADRLYLDSLGKGGVSGYMNNAFALTKDTKLIEKMAQLQNYSVSGKSGSERLLRNRLNKLFAKEIYNPKDLVRDLRQNKAPIKKEVKNKGENDKFAIENLPQGDELFSLLKTADNDTKMPEGFFDRFIDTFPLEKEEGESFFDENLEKQIFLTADNVIDDTMAELLPLMQERINPLLRGAKAVASDNKSSKVDTVVLDNTFGDKVNIIDTGNKSSQATGVYFDANRLNLIEPIYSDNLYQKSCKKIDQLQHNF